MARATFSLLLAALLAAPPARAQLGIDLGAPPKKDAPAQKVKEKDARRKKEQGKKKAAPAKPASKPRPEKAEPPAPTPAPARPPDPEPERAAPPPPPPAERIAPAPAPAPERLPEPPPQRPARRERTQQPGLALTPLDPRAGGAAKERLDAAKKLLDAKDPEAAALALDAILKDPKLAQVHDEARYQRAKALARLGLHYSALAAFDEVLERGPSGTRFFHSAMEWLFWLGRRLPNEQPLLARVARYAAQGVPPTYEDRVNYVLARYEFERGRALAEAGRSGEARAAWGEARRLAARVKDGLAPGPALPQVAANDVPSETAGDVYARARFVDGLVTYAEGNDAAAIEHFKEVVRLTNPRKARDSDPALRELAFLQLARIHYQNRQNRYAIFYYGKMPWGGRRWLEGLWEASYAHYRVGDYERTLGNLLTLQSPYFVDEYFPESYVLKAIVYYENCRYPEARQVLEQFAGMYDPVYAELTRLTQRPRTPDAYYELVRGGASGEVPRRLVKLAQTDQNVGRLVESIGAMEREMDAGLGGRPALRAAALGKELHERLSADRAVLVEEAGQRLRAKLEYERDQLRQLLAQALRIQIEVSRKEREALEGSLAKGSQVEVVRDLKFSYAVSDEHLYWPYEGEFWRDELGTYSYTLTKGCKDRLPRSRTAAR
jgi:tetratricopeptide (TPR) repeat protein